MHTELAQRRSHWYATSGLVLVAAGAGWDAAWHRRHDDHAIGGVTELVEAHWLMALGICVIAGSAIVAVVRAGRRASMVTRTILVGSTLAMTGFAWDSVRHAQGTESTPAHLLIYAGLLAVTVGLILAVATRRRARGTSGSPD